MDSNPPKNNSLSSEDNKKNPPRRNTSARASRADDAATTTTGTTPAAGRPQPSESQLRQMEQDLLDKSRATSTTATTTTTVRRRPGAGATASSATGSTTGSRSALRQLESDQQIKNEARGSGTSAAAPGTMTGSGRASSRGVVAGAQAVASAPSQNPKRTGSGAKATVGGSQQGKGNAGGSREPRSLRNLEEEIATKTRGSAKAPPNASGEVQRFSSRLQQMEDDLATKTRARSSFVNSDDHPQPLQASQRTDSQQRASLRNMEDDIVAKRRAQPSSFVSTTSTGSRGKATSGAAAASSLAESSALGNYDDAFADEYQQYPDDSKQKKTTESSLNQPNQNAGDGTFRASSLQPTSDVGLAPLTLSQPERDFPIQESAPVVRATSEDVESGGIEAFVADHDVVDAMGVAVVLSEEEEERLERKRHRRYMMYGVLAFFVIAAAIVAAVVLTVGQPDPPAPLVPTMTPSEAPSMVPSAAPTTTRLEAWIQALKSVSAEEALNNRTSPQYQAALWVADEDELQLEVGSPRGLQRYALAVFYFALDGENWEQCGRQDPTCGGDPNDRAWLLKTENECDWLGVDCDITNSIVTSIFFARQLGNGLSGYLPPELTILTDLEALILQRNDLKGTLPGFLGKLKKLQALFFLGNKFEGSIPQELLTGATLLGTIHFGENMLTGTIPTVVAKLPILTLNFANNLLTGAIPSEIGLLTAMSKWVFERNVFAFFWYETELTRSCEILSVLGTMEQPTFGFNSG